jgi:hypothetical protein
MVEGTPFVEHPEWAPAIDMDVGRAWEPIETTG